MGPDRGRSFGMPVTEFVEKMWPQLAAGLEHVIVGAIGSEESFLGSVKSRRELFEILSGHLFSHS